MRPPSSLPPRLLRVWLDCTLCCSLFAFQRGFLQLCYDADALVRPPTLNPHPTTPPALIDSDTCTSVSTDIDTDVDIDQQMRSALKALNEALERERARNARELKAAEKAAAEAKAATKAQAVQQAAAAEIEALNGGQAGGRYLLYTYDADDDAV